MTAYVLLALLSGPALPEFGLDYSSGIVHWLSRQQNPYGGFSSTQVREPDRFGGWWEPDRSAPQDTVVALQALAKYGAATYSPEGSTTVTVTSLGGLHKEFTVDQSNRLLYQEEKLSEVPGEYTIRAVGRSCVMAQVKQRVHQGGAKTRAVPTSGLVLTLRLSSDLLPLQHPPSPRLLRLQRLRRHHAQLQRQPAVRPRGRRQVPGQEGGNQHGHRQHQAAVWLRPDGERARRGQWSSTAPSPRRPCLAALTAVFCVDEGGRLGEARGRGGRIHQRLPGRGEVVAG